MHDAPKVVRVGCSTPPLIPWAAQGPMGAMFVDITPSQCGRTNSPHGCRFAWWFLVSYRGVLKDSMDWIDSIVTPTCKKVAISTL